MKVFLPALLLVLALVGAAVILLSLQLMINSIPYAEWVRLQKERYEMKKSK